MERRSFEEEIGEMEVQETDFEPLQRERSNTWHGDFMYLESRPHAISTIPEKVTSSEESESIKLDVDFKRETEAESEILLGTVQTEPSSAKKGSMRRNAWGNASYAELIAQAIECSPEKRLTLTQIYEWMIKNIPYFQLRSDGPSSMGWKNSIRHNLSLHNQFSRVQNEGTGKSSWWIVNRNFVKNKVPRRRATMGDPAIMDRKRCRVTKKLRSQEADPIPTQDDNSIRKIRTISEASEAILDIDPKSNACIKKSSSQSVTLASINGSSDKSICAMSQETNDKFLLTGTTGHVLHWPNSKEVSDHDQSPPSDNLAHAVHSSVPLKVQPSQIGFSMKHASNHQNHNSIILKVQPTNVASNYFEPCSLSSPILLYVAPAEKHKVLPSSTDQVDQSICSMIKQRPIQSTGNISGSTMSDLNKQTNQMSLGESDKFKVYQPIFNISEKRQKMLLELLHSERFCQLRRQNPELNRKIIDMLQRKKNMLLTKNIRDDNPQEESQMELQNLLRAHNSSSEERTEWLSFKFNCSSEDIQSNVFSSNNSSESISGKTEHFVDSFEFGQSNSFQADVDPNMGDMDFDGNIDDLFGATGLLLNCEDDLNTLSHEFS